MAVELTESCRIKMVTAAPRASTSLAMRATRVSTPPRLDAEFWIRMTLFGSARMFILRYLCRSSERKPGEGLAITGIGLTPSVLSVAVLDIDCRAWYPAQALRKGLVRRFAAARKALNPRINEQKSQLAGGPESQGLRRRFRSVEN